tara:strand:+ start:138 stop:563 length:426 start_codon:yes stop_codon:yes gene_type:complete
MIHGTEARNPPKFSMAKKLGSGLRGPYKTENDVTDPDQLGAGGIRLRQHRLSKAWTVEFLAERAKVSPGTVSGIENGTSGYSHVTLVKLSKALGTSVGALFDVDPREGLGREFWPVWHQASDPEKQRITDYAKGVVEGRKR